MKGKQRCKILKEIRRQIAENNDIEYVTSECQHQGDCAGTCPKCEAEVRYLERELERRARLGKAVTVAGLAATITATSISATACSAFHTTAGDPMPDYTDTPQSQPLQSVDFYTFTPNFVASHNRNSRTSLLQEVLSASGYQEQSRWRMLTFWDDYFVGFEDNTDYYRLYHKTRDAEKTLTLEQKTCLLAVTYTDDGQLSSVDVTMSSPKQQNFSSPDELMALYGKRHADVLLPYVASLALGNKSASSVSTGKFLRLLSEDWWADAYLGVHEHIPELHYFALSDGRTMWCYLYNSTIYFDVTAPEKHPNYVSWMMSYLHPSVLSDVSGAQDVADLNARFAGTPVRTYFLHHWYLSLVHYTEDTDYYRPDKNSQTVYAVTYGSDGIIAEINKLKISEISTLCPPVMEAEEFFGLTDAALVLENMLNLATKAKIPGTESSVDAVAYGQKLKKKWKSARVSTTKEDDREVCEYEVNGLHLWVTYGKSNRFEYASAYNPFEITGDVAATGWNASPVDNP